MNFKFAAVFLCAVLVFCTNPVFSDEINLIENGTFESGTLTWTNSYITGTNVQSGLFSMAFSNPYTDEKFGNCHITDYETPVALNKDTVYRLEFWIKGTYSQGSPKCLVDIDNENHIKFTVTGTSSDWKYVSACFIVAADSDYELSIASAGADFNAEMYLDNINISKIDFKPVSMDIEGQRTVYIPEIGAETYRYKAAVADRSGNSVPVLTGGISVSDVLPKGILYNPETCILTVDSTALNGSVIKLTAYSVNGISSKDIIIKTVKSFIENGTFENLPIGSGWTGGDYTLINDNRQGICAKINTAFVDENLYYGVLHPEREYYFESRSDSMYVWRARVRSDAGYTSRKVQTETDGPSEDGEISINISQIGGSDWISVSGVISIYAAGIYSLKFNFVAPDGRPLYIDDIAISLENPAPTDIIFNAPAHICIPGSGRIYAPIDYAVRDQGGNVLPDESISISVKPEKAGVSIEGSNIVVSGNAVEKDFVFTAVSDANNDVKGTHTITVNRQTVGDGSFEKTSPGDLWATAYPSVFNITQTFQGNYPTEGQYMGKLTMNGAVSVLFSDSVGKYSPDKSYVFKADMVKAVPDIDTIVTVLVSSASEGSFDDNMVIGQFSLDSRDSHIQKVFSPSEEFTGRIMIAFTTPEEHNTQIILMDSITIVNAVAAASDVYISGSPYVDKYIVGKYSFSTNFNGTDASSYRWLISNTKDGVFMPIEGEYSQTLSITENMDNKYLKFEVTPISLNGPVTGESVVSKAIKIGESIPDTTWVEGENSNPETPPENTTDNPPDNTTDTAKGELNAVDLNKTYYHLTFADMSSHWAKDDVYTMAAAGIANGRGNGLFEPEETITRAEFSTFLIRAFGLAPIYYDNLFDDVKSYSWYAGAIATVTKYGIANGISEKEFSPETPVTREQMAVMIMRAYKKTGASLLTPTSTFADSSKFSPWATEEISQAAALGIFKGIPGNYFEPKAKATRAEAIVAIKRMIEAVIKNA